MAIEKAWVCANAKFRGIMITRRQIEGKESADQKTKRHRRCETFRSTPIDPRKRSCESWLNMPAA
jgi:hypothetical protein